MDYKVGEEYELGKYLGIITVFPYNKDYVEKVHKFAKANNGEGFNKCAIITEVFIEKISRKEYGVKEA
jgi:hypothetical protein